MVFVTISGVETTPTMTPIGRKFERLRVREIFSSLMSLWILNFFVFLYSIFICFWILFFFRVNIIYVLCFYFVYIFLLLIILLFILWYYCIASKVISMFLFYFILFNISQPTWRKYFSHTTQRDAQVKDDDDGGGGVSCFYQGCTINDFLKVYYIYLFSKFFFPKMNNIFSCCYISHLTVNILFYISALQWEG